LLTALFEWITVFTIPFRFKMETLVNSRIATEFDSRKQPFSDPLLSSVGINHFAMIRILSDNCPEFAVALNKGQIQNVSFSI
jgi:hypothetical protein